MKNTAKKIQPVKKTKQNIFKLSTKDLKAIYGGRGGIVTVGASRGGIVTDGAE